MSDQHDREGPKTPAAVTGAPEQAARRKVLRGAAVAMPMVLTLHSGAALARTSNLISASGSTSNTSAYCLDENSIVEHLGDNRYDLGEPPALNVDVIPDRQYYTSQSTSGQAVPRETMCESGGNYYYKQNGTWSDAKTVNQGIMVSATAISSFAAYTSFREI